MCASVCLCVCQCVCVCLSVCLSMCASLCVSVCTLLHPEPFACILLISLLQNTVLVPILWEGNGAGLFERIRVYGSLSQHGET